MMAAAREIRLVLSWPPSVNKYWRAVGGQIKVSREGRLYHKAVIGEVFAQRVASGDLRRAPMYGRLDVTVQLHPPDRRRRDIDNFHKALLDALLKAGVYFDDDQIDHLDTYRMPPSPPSGRVEVRIVEATDRAKSE